MSRSPKERDIPQSKLEFDKRFEELNATPKKYLKLFLEGKSDQEIAAELPCDRSNVSKHVYSICAHFGFAKLDDLEMESPKRRERDTRRDDLIDLFIDFKPEWVCPELQVRFRLHPTEHPELEIPEGLVPLDSKFYIERPPLEKDCFQTISLAGALIRIKTPRQMGKSSLVIRILHNAIQQGSQGVYLSLQSAGEAVFTSHDHFLYWFCLRISRKLNLGNQLTQYLSESWGSAFPSNDKCTDFFELFLLPELGKPLVLCLDDVDELFKHPTIARDFFSLLRAWHEEAKVNPIWGNFRLIITYSKEIYIPLDINQSPFNVGLSIELPAFNQIQIGDLIKRHGILWTDSETQELIQMLGGHPYLLREALFHIARGKLTLHQCLETAPTESGLYSSHLRRHWQNLYGNEELRIAMQQVVESDAPIRLKSEVAFQLASMGLVQYQGNNVIPWCNLYRLYLRPLLGREG
jgi:hypothetical protein